MTLKLIHKVCKASALAVLFLQAQRCCAISYFIPIAFMSLLTQLLHVFIRAPLPTTPVTFILGHSFTQSFSSSRSTCPTHLNHALWIFSSTQSMPKRLNNSSLCFLSFNETPHAHTSYTIILSALFNLFMQVLHIHSPHLDTIYQHSLNTGIIYYIFLFIFEKMLLFVKTGVSSLNFSQSAYTLALEKFYEAISHTVDSCCGGQRCSDENRSTSLSSQ